MRVIIEIEVNGKKLKNVAMGPLGCSVNATLNQSGISKGKMIRNVNCPPSREFGANAPNAPSKDAYNKYPRRKYKIPQMTKPGGRSKVDAISAISERNKQNLI